MKQYRDKNFTTVHKPDEFWKEYLKNIPDVHSFPLDFPRTIRSRTYRENLTICISKDVSDSIRNLCKTNKISPYIFFISSFVLLIWKYTSQETIVIGTQKSEPEESKQILLSLKSIPLRFDIDPSVTVNEWFRYVNKQYLSAYSIAEHDFDSLKDILNTPQNTNFNPIFQIVLNYQLSQNAHIKNYIDSEPKNDFELCMQESDSFSGTLEYSANLFEKNHMELFIKNLKSLIHNIINNPGVLLKDLIFLGKEDIIFLQNLNATDVPEYIYSDFLKLFNHSCSKYGNNIAIWYEGISLTYQEVHEASNKIAMRLINAGIKPQSFIGVYLNRWPLLPIVFIGVMKAGCAYIPLDPHFPDERLKIIIKDSNLQLLITETDNSENSLIKELSLPIILADIDEDIANNQLPVIYPDQYVYMLFTSGSTGKPKGVPITHKALANFLLSMKDKPGISEKDKVLALTTMSFDISGLEMYLPLITGASMLMVSRETAMDGYSLSSIIEDEHVTMVQATPSTWTILFEAGWKGNDKLKLLVGGEALSQTLAEKMLNAGAEVWNMYGPTETTIWSSTCRITDSERDPYIGKPIANTKFYVLDKENRVLPPGIPGELGIGGIGLSTGYFNRPDLTKDHFIEINSLCETKTERIYKTGDMVQLCYSGNYKYLGRTDFQVKIRGFRIELEEIENIILKFEGILEAICNIWHCSETDKRLVAYYRSDSRIDENELRKYLKTKLPYYMIPSFIINMKNFPKTANSKTDRKALPLPDKL